MRHTMLLGTALGATLLLAHGTGLVPPAHASGMDHSIAQAALPDAVRGGAHAPTSALAGAAPGRGAYLPGSGVPTSGGGASDRTLTPDGAILPGTSTPGGHNTSGS